MLNEMAALRVERDRLRKALAFFEGDGLVEAQIAQAERLREEFSEYAQHSSWRCGHPDRYRWEPDCPCGLTRVCRELGIEVHNG